MDTLRNKIRQLSAVCFTLCMGLGSSNAWAQASTPKHGPFEVMRVVDGDTIWVRLAERTEKLRLLSVNTEECRWSDAEDDHAKGTAFGDATAAWARQQFPTGEPPAKVWLEYDGPTGQRDSFGRLLCHVLRADGSDFNLQLVREGKSPYFTKYGFSVHHDVEFRRAQKEAQRAQLGIWSVPSQARKDAPPYGWWLPWWDARAVAIRGFRARCAAGEAIWDSYRGETLKTLVRAHKTGQRVETFGAVVRFFEEADGTLTALLDSDGAGPSLRLKLPAALRASSTEETLRQSRRIGRQNYLYADGTLKMGKRGPELHATPNSKWRLAGPQPASGHSGESHVRQRD